MLCLHSIFLEREAFIARQLRSERGLHEKIWWTVTRARNGKDRSARCLAQPGGRNPLAECALEASAALGRAGLAQFSRSIVGHSGPHFEQPYATRRAWTSGRSCANSIRPPRAWLAGAPNQSSTASGSLRTRSVRAS